MPIDPRSISRLPRSNQWPEGRNFIRLYADSDSDSPLEQGVERQTRLAEHFVGLYDLLRMKNRTEAMGSLAATMQVFAELFPEFLQNPQTEEQQRLVSLYTSAMNGETSESI